MAAVAALGLAATAGCSGPPGAELVSSEVEGHSNLIWLGDWVYYQASYEDSDSGTPFERVPAAGGRAEEVPVDGLEDCMNNYLESPEPDCVVAVSDHELGLEYSCHTVDSSRPVYVDGMPTVTGRPWWTGRSRYSRRDRNGVPGRGGRWLDGVLHRPLRNRRGRTGFDLGRLPA